MISSTTFNKIFERKIFINSELIEFRKEIVKKSELSNNNDLKKNAQSKINLLTDIENFLDMCFKQMEEDLASKAKLSEYVSELVSKNEELEAKIKFLEK